MSRRPGRNLTGPALDPPLYRGIESGVTSRNDRKGDPMKRGDRIHPLVVVGVCLFGVGIISAVWLWDWRYLATGAVAMVLAALISEL